MYPDDRPLRPASFKGNCLSHDDDHGHLECAICAAVMGHCLKKFGLCYRDFVEDFQTKAEELEDDRYWAPDGTDYYPLASLESFWEDLKASLVAQRKEMKLYLGNHVGFGQLHCLLGESEATHDSNDTELCQEELAKQQSNVHHQIFAVAGKFINDLEECLEVLVHKPLRNPEVISALPMVDSTLLVENCMEFSREWCRDLLIEVCADCGFYFQSVLLPPFDPNSRRIARRHVLENVDVSDGQEEEEADPFRVRVRRNFYFGIH